MSRSYKKHPIIKDYNKGSKQMANKKTRRVVNNMESTNKGNWYKKISNQYDISDWMYFPDSEEDKIKFSRK